MSPTTLNARVSKVQLLTVQGALDTDLIEKLGTDDDRGIVVLVEVVSQHGPRTGVAVGRVGSGWGARERTFTLTAELAERLHDAVVDVAGPADIDARCSEMTRRLSSQVEDDESAQDASNAAREGVSAAMRHALMATWSPGSFESDIDARELLARLVPTANRYHVVPAPPPMTVEGRPSNTYPELRFLQPLGVNGTKGHLLERQALTQGFDTLRFTKGSFLASRAGGDDLNFKWSRSPLSSAVSIALCNHKEATRIQLRRHGIPTPRGRMFVRGDYENAVTFASHIGYPVVSKPAAGVRGIGVVANIQNEGELRSAFEAYAESRLGGDDFIVEKHIDGGDYRIVVIEDRVVAAILRVPASVIGDGQQTVGELILQKNELRRQNPHLWGRLIKVDRSALRRLDRQGLSLTSVPPTGVQVLLSDTSSLSQGGDSIDVMDEMHPTIKEAAVAATAAIPGLRYCGVDFLLADHRVPLDEQTSVGICELNAHAAIGNGEYPMFGSPRHVAKVLFGRCAVEAGHELKPPAETLKVQLEVRGKVTKTGYQQWLYRQATDFGLTGWVQERGKRTVHALVQGPALAASALASLAVLGPRRALPTTVRTTHSDAPPMSSFEVRE